MTRTVKAIMAVLLIAVLSGGWMLMSSRSTAEPTAPPAAPKTAVLERRDLVETEDFQGRLVYDGSRRVTAGTAGTVLELAREGSTVRRGERIFEIEGLATRLLYGSSPAWRDFHSGMSDGRDVTQLERNLKAMGYDPYDAIDVDHDFDAATTDAIQRWEADLGLTEDGVLTPAEVVFAPGALRIGAHEVDRGTRVGPGAPVLTATSTRQVVELDLPADQRDIARVGKKVNVDLPDGADMSGRIAAVGSVVEPPSEQGGESTVAVEIRLDDVVRVFEEAPVEVTIETGRARDALAAPVTAVLALAEGGYALEVVRGSRTELVPVDLGDHADGWVEIVAGGLEEGTTVVVAG
ncbi:MAG TPA: peptidoglycan-binding protein [Actinomycetota bacterium]|nr:peptidoglycan-binding protein [Actinomycetota bacterium]